MWLIRYVLSTIQIYYATIITPKSIILEEQVIIYEKVRIYFVKPKFISSKTPNQSP